MKLFLSRSVAKWLGVAVVPLLLAGAGCNTYSYLNVDVKIDTSSWSTLTAQGVVASCSMFVSGAVTDQFDVNQGAGAGGPCPPQAPNPDVGIVSYSTFAESGNVTFTLKAYQGAGQHPECQAGEGTTTLAIAMGKTVSGTLLIHDTGMRCP